VTEQRARSERMRSPRLADVMQAVAVDYGVCTRPITVRRIDLDTGETTVIDVPCGATLASKCPSCAERRKRLRMAQCRVGWHLENEPDLEPDEPTEEQRWLVTFRADVQAQRDAAEGAGQDTDDLDQVLDDIDEQLRALGVRGKAGIGKARRTRSTRRRQDAPDLPRRRVDPRTVGRAFTTPEGKVFRPSMGLTLTLGSYGRVHPDGTPVDPASYDYRSAARDAIHFPKLVDRFWQNLRRVVGYDVQYFAAVEPQKRLAPHLHAAVRGTIARAALRQVVAATYHQVWWPPCDTAVYVDQDPAWDEQRKAYVDPDIKQPLPTWDEALDALDADDDAPPSHVVRFGVQLHAEGVLAGTAQADRWIGYVGKYLTKTVDQCHNPETDRQHDHVDRLWQALRFEPCSPTCANWLRYGVQPKDTRPGLKPGFCRGRAHRRETLGFGGRRVLVSRKWSGKTLADHKHDQRDWVLATLGISATDPEATRYAWEPVKPDDPDVSPLTHRLMRAIADRARWRQALDSARCAAASQPPPDRSTTEQAA
jgi:replication initiator protein RepSA